MHFANVELTDGVQQFSENCKEYVCVLANPLLLTMSLSRSHCIIPESGTGVTVNHDIIPPCFIYLR